MQINVELKGAAFQLHAHWRRDESEREQESAWSSMKCMMMINANNMKLKITQGVDNGRVNR